MARTSPNGPIWTVGPTRRGSHLVGPAAADHGAGGRDTPGAGCHVRAGCRGRLRGSGAGRRPGSIYQAGAGLAVDQAQARLPHGWQTPSTSSLSARTPGEVGGGAPTARYCWPRTTRRLSSIRRSANAAQVLRCRAGRAGAGWTADPDAAAARVDSRPRGCVVRAKPGPGVLSGAHAVAEPHRRLGPAQGRRWAVDAVPPSLAAGATTRSPRTPPYRSATLELYRTARRAPAG